MGNRLQRGLAWLAAALAVTTAVPPPRLHAAGAADPTVGPEVELHMTDGTVLSGGLVAITPTEVRLLAGDSTRTVATATVRRLVRPSDAAQVGGHGPVTVIGVDGSRLTGNRFLWQGETATLELTEGAVRLPIERVRTVVMLSPQAPQRESEPAWLEALPAEPTADVVAVARGDGFELVECAVVEVAPESVTVLLDGERIAVKSGKVLGVSWVRPVAAGTRPGTRVTVAGGRLMAERVEWSPRELVLDGVLRLPGGMVQEVDYAAGRTVSLAMLAAERVTAEPFFAALAVDGMKAFFEPRAVRGPGDPATDSTVKSSLLVRPRTVAVWRVPADSRRFSGTLRRPDRASGSVAVRVLLDDVPAFTARLGDPDAKRAADQGAEGGRQFDIDVSAARRLTIDVDFVPGDLGCPVRLDAAVFEK